MAFRAEENYFRQFGLNKTLLPQMEVFQRCSAAQVFIIRDFLGEMSAADPMFSGFNVLSRHSWDSGAVTVD